MLVLRRGDMEFVEYAEHPDGASNYGDNPDYLITFVLSKSTGQPKEVRRLHCIAWMKPNCVGSEWFYNMVRGEWEEALNKLSMILAATQPSKYIPRPAISDNEINLALELYRNHIRGGIIEQCESKDETESIVLDDYRILRINNNSPLPIQNKALMRIVERGITEAGGEHWRGAYVGDGREVVLTKSCFIPLPPKDLEQLNIDVFYVNEPMSKVDGGNGYKIQVHGGYAGIGVNLVLSTEYNVLSTQNQLKLMKLINDNWEQGYTQAGLPKVTAEHLDEFCNWKVDTAYSEVTLHQMQEVCKYLRSEEASKKLIEAGHVRVTFHPKNTKFEIVKL